MLFSNKCATTGVWKYVNIIQLKSNYKTNKQTGSDCEQVNRKHNFVYKKYKQYPLKEIVMFIYKIESFQLIAENFTIFPVPIICIVYMYFVFHAKYQILYFYLYFPH